MAQNLAKRVDIDLIYCKYQAQVYDVDFVVQFVPGQAQI